MLKALIINGSPHKNGATTKILKMIEEKINNRYEIELIHAYDLNIKPCIGCFKCRPNSSCVLPEDDGQIIGKKITDANLLIVGSPTYWGNITAPLKLVFERNVVTFENFINVYPEPKMKGKKALIAVTSGSGVKEYKKISQSYGAKQAIKTVMQSAGYKIYGTINMHSAWDFDKYKNTIELKVSKITKKI